MAIRLPGGNYPLAGDPPDTAKRSRGLVAEPTWWLRALSYGAYRSSEHWQIRRREFIATAKEQGRYCCWRCGLDEIDMVEVDLMWCCDGEGRACDCRSKKSFENHATAEDTRLPRLDVHHLTYENLCAERDEDLELLCHPCHNLEHKPNSPAAKWWLSYLEHMDMLSPGHKQYQPRNVEPIIPGVDQSPWEEDDE